MAYTTLSTQKAKKKNTDKTNTPANSSRIDADNDPIPNYLIVRIVQ